MLISVIISTYNWPDALGCVLNALKHQSDQNFEILIADDGSSDKTKEVINQFSKFSSILVTHVWQEDCGFRAAAIRNKAVVQAKGEYLVFIDGDCIALPSFIQQHRFLAEKNFFVSGNRVLLSEKATPKYLENEELFSKASLWLWIMRWWKGDCNRWLPFVKLNLGALRKLRHQRWKGAKTCNLGVFRQDFIAINGMDETYIGWGFEDSDLVVRLQNSGIKRKDGRCFIPIIHLWHLQNKHPVTSVENFSRLQDVIKSKVSWAIKGINQYIAN